MLPFLSLNAVNAAGGGNVLDLESPVADFTLWLLNAGTGSANVVLEGSPDGTNWVGVINGGATTTGPGMTAVSAGPSAPLTAVFWCRYVRARFTSINTGAPVVSAWITASRPNGEE